MIEAGRHFGGGTQQVATADLLPAGVTPTDLAEILFCSSLQPSQAADAAAVGAALAQSLRTHGNQVTACTAELAEAYGKDPDIACRRMRWCRELVGVLAG